MMPQKIIVRPAVLQDSTFILDSIFELAEYEKLKDECRLELSDIESNFFGSSPKVFAHIAEWEEQKIGVAIFFYNFSTFVGRHGIYLEDLFVWPQHRSKGAGLALLRSLAVKAQNENLGRVEWSVLDWNEPAIKFYKRILALPQDEWTVFRLNDKAIAQLADS